MCNNVNKQNVKFYICLDLIIHRLVTVPRFPLPVRFFQQKTAVFVLGINAYVTRKVKGY